MYSALSDAHHMLDVAFLTGLYLPSASLQVVPCPIYTSALGRSRALAQMQLKDGEMDRIDDDLDSSILDDLETQLRLAARGPVARKRARLRASRDGLDDVRRANGPLGPVGPVLRRLSSELAGSLNEYSESPSQQLILGSLALLFGFYVANGQFLGGGDQGGRWEYVSGGVAVFLVERITRGYYALPQARRSPTLRLLNAFKVGFFYGCALDAFKLGGH